MKKLQIDRGELLLALEAPDGMEYFLDRATGEILMRGGDDPALEEIEARLEAGSEGRHEAIEPTPSHERFEVMQDFAEPLPESFLKTRLVDALAEKRPFRRFKDALCDDGRVRGRWYDFERAAATRTAERWLASLGIDFEWGGPAADRTTG